MTGHLTFRKSERLSFRSQIDTLFKKGLSFRLSPFKVMYEVGHDTIRPGVKMLVTVPRKRFKRAVDRNHIKRLIREAYRLHKNLLYGSLNTSTIELHLGFVYTGNQADITYHEIADSMIRCLERLKQLLENDLQHDPL